MVWHAGTNTHRGKGFMTVLIFIYAKLLHTRKEAAETFAISMRKIDELVANGELKPCQIDHSVRGRRQ
jgi:hypothetical protein